MSHTRLDIGADRIATLWLDAPEKRVNTLSKQMWSDLSSAIDQVVQAQPIALIITSNKPNTFVVGADLFEMREMSDEVLDDYIRTGQRILARIEALTIPTIAAINGDCLGGGLELAMACGVRICADDPKIRIGLPETNLGLCPAWGGTVRMQKIIGLEKAIMMTAKGETIDPQRAHHIGLVDQIVPADQLLSAARAVPSPKPRTHSDIVPKRILLWAEEKVRSDLTGDNAIAPLRVLQVIRDGMLKPDDNSGFEAERKAMLELRRFPSSQKMLQAFFDRHSAPMQHATA
jgi:3-hydroxyacyl-CoA dehydrogenase/enoyl-CoA hydratase/3-hydroxybutyryl-CoA epimerase